MCDCQDVIGSNYRKFLGLAVPFPARLIADHSTVVRVESWDMTMDADGHSAGNFDVCFGAGANERNTAIGIHTFFRDWEPVP